MIVAYSNTVAMELMTSVCILDILIKYDPWELLPHWVKAGRGDEWRVIQDDSKVVVLSKCKMDLKSIEMGNTTCGTGFEQDQEFSFEYVVIYAIYIRYSSGEVNQYVNNVEM